MYSPIVVKDGQVISTTPNYYTHHCQCLECGKRFDATEHNDMIESIEVVEGFAATSSLPYETIKITADEARAAMDKTVSAWASAAEEIYDKRIMNLQSELRHKSDGYE